MMFRRVKIVVGFVIIALVALACQSNSTQITPVSDYFSNPEKTTFRMSPNGKFLSYLKHVDSENQLVLLDISQRTPLEITQDNQVHKIISYQWTDSTEIVYSARNQDKGLDVFVMNVQNGQTDLLVSTKARQIRFITPVRKRHGGILVTMNERDSNVMDVYRLFTREKRKEMVYQNPGNITRWFVDLKGELRLAQAGDSIQETILYRKSEKEPFVAVTQNVFYNNLSPIGFVKDKPDHIFALSNLKRDKSSLVELDLMSGEEKVVYSHPEVDVSSGGYASESGEMVYAYWIHQHRERHFLDQRFENTYMKLEQHLPGYEFRVIDEDFSKQRIVVHAFKDTDPGVICYFDGAQNRFIELYEINSKLKDKALGKMQPISFYSRDNLKIHGFLTLPPGGNNQKLPVIVFPHGGPSERNFWGYNPEVQFFANRGYAVLQVNYRGSTGYGKAFWQAGFHEWGGKIQEDIRDGVQWLIEEKIADPKRIGMYGSGFGGYSALFSATFNADLYACAASYGGFSNLFTHIREVPPFLKPYLQKYYMIIGNPESDSQRLRATSPVFYAEKVSIPLFIAQGGKDSRSSANEMDQFIRKIRKNNIPIQYMFREEEGRTFKKEENRFLLYEELSQFFDVHLKNK